MKTLIPIFGLLACCLPAAAEGPHRVKIVNAAVVMIFTRWKTRRS